MNAILGTLCFLGLVAWCVTLYENRDREYWRRWSDEEWEQNRKH